MASDNTGSVTIWIGELLKADGDVNAATQQLWEHYFKRLVYSARRHLSLRVIADEEDAALSAFNSFYAGARAGRFPQLADRNDLWQLLLTITERKAKEQVRRELRKKRGEGKVIHEAALKALDQSDIDVGLDQIVISPEPTPEFAAITAEECTRLLGLLNDRERQVAIGRMAGYSHEEIADRLGCSSRWAIRLQKDIRDKWSKELGRNGAGVSGAGAETAPLGQTDSIPHP
jgi:DNA-directed RNA polymerase specialized sigma24 family protein